ncbi:hypothetical protein THASP1DRAFT_29125, partial [Thamnocephalis sphaerospora]
MARDLIFDTDYSNTQPTEPKLWRAPVQYKVTPNSLDIGPGYTDGTINTPRPFTIEFSYTIDISGQEDRYWVFGGAIATGYGSGSVRLPFQIRVGNPAHVMPLNVSSAELVSVNEQGIMSGVTSFVVRPNVTLVAVRFRLQFPSERLFVAVEHAETKRRIGIVAGSYGENMGHTVGSKDNDFFIRWTGRIQAMSGFNQPAINVTTVPDGDYRLRLYVALPFSNHSNADAYKTWQSPVVSVSGIDAETGDTDQSEGGGALPGILPRAFGRGDP